MEVVIKLDNFPSEVNLFIQDRTSYFVLSPSPPPHPEPRPGDLVFYPESQTKQFRHFLARANRYPSLQVGGTGEEEKGRKVVLVEVSYWVLRDPSQSRSRPIPSVRLLLFDLGVSECLHPRPKQVPWSDTVRLNVNKWCHMNGFEFKYLNIF